MNFSVFKNAVAKRFNVMSSAALFRTKALDDEMWNTYLGAFPEGTNPIYRQRREYDCNCCRQFIKAVGNVVSIGEGGELNSIWDISIDSVFQIVADTMSALVKSKEIDGPFFHHECTAGQDKSFDKTITGEVFSRECFFVNIPSRFVNNDPGSVLSDARATHAVFMRGVKGITKGALDTVSELIAQNTLYRGSEQKYIIEQFKGMRDNYLRLPTDGHAWLLVQTNANAASRIRNSSIGTMLTNLSEGMDVDQAQAMYEAIVAPANYKRPTAAVTPAMVAKARETVEELGLTSALSRRYANMSDITINNILYADRSIVKSLTDDLFSDIARSAPRQSARIEEMGIEEFISNVLPTVKSMEVLMTDKHMGNLVSLVAPSDPTAGSLFKWPNNFSWSYNGDFADSIKERVEAAGGNVDGDFADSIKERVRAAGGNVDGDVCCRLAWNNSDYLDLHMQEPFGGTHIYFVNKRRLSINGGKLDVDANDGDGSRLNPVENIFYGNLNSMQDGIYTLSVHQFLQRNLSSDGFEVEIDVKGNVTSLVYDKVLRNGRKIDICTIQKSGASVIVVPSSEMSSTTKVKDTWGIKTNIYQRVNMLMLSPNFWDGEDIGNKHYFFMIDGCKNEGTARGFYNEFLSSDLDKHRKVFELVGGKMRTENTEEQLSGLGFSSTQRNSIMVRVQGSFTRQIKINF